MLVARQEKEAEKEWDKPSDSSVRVAEIIAAARERLERGEAPKWDRSPIHIPPGKEDSVRGRLIVRINEANARMARYEAEKQAER
jgi:hypothetical protein